jgi:hypothetical protein
MQIYFLLAAVAAAAAAVAITEKAKRERKTLSRNNCCLSLSPDYFLHCQRKETQKFENFLAGVISSGSLIPDFLQLRALN